MGRGRGRGRRLNHTTSHDDLGSTGEEVVMAYRRGGRQKKHLKDETDEELLQEGGMEIDVKEGDDVKTAGSPEESNGFVEAGKKRRRHLPAKENACLTVQEDGSDVRSGDNEPVKLSGFRPNSSRRKSTPRRAAEAGVECI